MAEKKVLLFQVFRGSTLLKAAEFTEENVTIGKGEAALLRIDDKDLADLHAVVNIEENGSVHLFDLGSQTGSNVNGTKVGSSGSVLRDGDTVTIGGAVRIVVGLKGLAAGRPSSADDFDEEATHVQSSPLDIGGGAAMSDNEEATDPGSSMKLGKKAKEDRDDPTEEEPAAPPAAKGATPKPAPMAAAAPVVAKPKNELVDDDDHSPHLDDHDIDDHHGPDEPPIDLMSIMVRTQPVDPSNKGAPMMLEVSQIWGEALLEDQRFQKGQNVTIGASVKHKLQVLGFKTIPIPEGAARIVQMANEATALPFLFIPVVNLLTPFMVGMQAFGAPSEWNCDFFVPENTLPGGKDHTLARWNGSQYVISAPSTWDGFVDTADKRYSFDEYVAAGKGKKTEAGYEIPMADDAKVAVDVDDRLFYAQMVQRGKTAAWRLTVDWVFLALVTLFALMAGVFAILMWVTPVPPQNEMVEIPDRYVELLMEKPPPEEKKKGGNPDAGEGAKAKKEEGKVGKKDAKMEKAKGDKVQMQKQEIDRQVVNNAGVMGALSDSDMSSTLGASGLNSDIQGGIGGLIGAKGTQIGSGGLGARGSGIGGGGTADGLGGLGTKGMGSGSSGYGSGGGNFGQKGEGGIAGVGGDPIILGALDRALIDEVIKRNMNKIRYCYQRELMKNNGLSGKIVIKFTIAKDGTVSSASTKQTTMNNSAVESCIEERFRQMQFPEPKGGGIVIVSYPFLFSPG